MREMKKRFSYHSTWDDKYFDGEISIGQTYDEYTHKIVDLVNDWNERYDSEYIVVNDDYTLAMKSGKIKRIL
ncbi:hypothetical protein [Paenibacillus pini]|uniref:Uncharacterized protein n=1 Tax=Paenibacillus pini JCM 16418 TaxID=1236976 RepID=W7Z8X4_9BACL|nr:hypothetical protein [Paenibacillus pini]GAF10919.1 hypothetical protein JCM16418_5156 [Paenibacillus pini JCM 16418]